MTEFATIAITLYVAHHVGDYWVQTDYQARHKGHPGWVGRVNCLSHVATYLATQMAMLSIVARVLDMRLAIVPVTVAMAISGVTHYMADRREHGLMVKLAMAIPGKRDFLGLGAPRQFQIYAQSTQHGDPRGPVPLDNPSLGTGSWALDQSWHIFWGVFVAALVATL